jgi:hypothetical protein
MMHIVSLLLLLCVFSAQKLGVTVDALVLSKEDSRFLQVRYAYERA